jgi:hypothetical protein
MNIHHAKALFDEVNRRRDCHVVAVDISGFFDTLNHSHLKSGVASILNVDRLEGHHWTVFRNVTRYSWVETVDLDFVLGKERFRGSRICSPIEFSNHVRGVTAGLVRVHDLPFGIPQGTPVSGLYANIYMLEFDRAMVELMKSLDGSYRRYSDDIALVVPATVDRSELVDIAQKFLADFELSLSEDKTDTSTFSGARLGCDQPTQYLGFVFDGQSILIRESSLNRYREKMERGIHAKLVAAKQNQISQSEVYQREARSRYTHLGKRRNFLKYAYRSADILHAPEIRQQVKGHVTWFERTWNREVKKVYGDAMTTA